MKKILEIGKSLNRFEERGNSFSGLFGLFHFVLSFIPSLRTQVVTVVTSGKKNTFENGLESGLRPPAGEAGSHAHRFDSCRGY